MTPYRCSAASLARAEPMFATASTVRAFLLVEYDGAWGREALRDSRLPPKVAQHLVPASLRLGIKTLLMRRHGRRTTSDRSTRVFAAYADPERSWLETTELDAVEEVVDVDLDALRRGSSLGLTAHHDPVFAVCTHGRHDTCCAELGRPLAAALSTRHPDSTWEVSHIGGDRFAGNVLVLPDGLYYGRVSTVDVVDVADRHLAGLLSRPHLRGRSGFPLSVQAAEHYLREALDEDGVAAVHLHSRRRRGDAWEVNLRAHGGLWRVRLRGEPQQPVQLTCAVARLTGTLRFVLTGIDRLTDDSASPTGAAGLSLERSDDA